MTDKSKRILKLLLRITVTSVLLIWVFCKIDRQQFVEVVRTARWSFLVAVWISVAVIYWINCIRMRLILKAQGCSLNTFTIFGVSAVTSLYSMVLPGMLSMGMKWYFLRKGTGKGINVFSSMLYNQLSNVIIMAIFGLGVLVVTNPASVIWPNTEGTQLLPLVCTILLVILVLFYVLLLNKNTGGKIIRVVSIILEPFPAKIRRKAQETIQQIASFQLVGWRFHVIMFLITLGGTSLGGVIMYFFSAKAANVSVPVSAFAWLWAVIFILQRVPISIANLGVREAILSSVLPIYGVEPSAAVLMSMILFSALVFMAVLGAVFHLSGFRTGARPDEAV